MSKLTDDLRGWSKFGYGVAASECMAKAADRLEVLGKALRDCRDTFEFYAGNHRAKGTPEADAKARANEMHVKTIEEILSEAD